MGRKGLTGVVEALPARGSLLDAAGQVAGYWCASHATENQEALPFRVDSVTFYSPHPDVGTRVRCDVHILEFNDLWGRFDIDMHRDGRVWARIKGWEDRRFEADPAMRKVMLFPENHIYAKPDPEGFFVTRESWRSAASRYFIARRWLDWDDMGHYLAKNPRAQRFWLLGRISANDAVRQWLWDHGYGKLHPVQIRIRNEESGRPVVSGPFTEDLRLSVAHTEGLGVALVSEGRDVGIDVEKIVPRDEDLIRSAFTEAEQALLPEQDRDEWLTRLWVAKEAVGKLRGTGLAGKPKSLQLSEIDGERLCVDGAWVSTRRDGEHVIGWTRQDG
jgi:phosphopantetheinyl transferase